MVLPPVGVEVVVKTIPNVVSDFDRSIFPVVLNSVLVVVPLGLVKAVCYILVVPEVTDVIAISGTVRLKLRQFTLVLRTLILPKLLVNKWLRRFV